ncbi:hypothetical protein POUND7_008616 [Theobroma cacao]
MSVISPFSCASNEDCTVVEPLLHPEGAKPGECVSFSGIDGKPEDVLNPGRQLEKTTLYCAFLNLGIRSMGLVSVITVSFLFSLLYLASGFKFLEYPHFLIFN